MILLSFLPILLFVAIYVGTGVYLSFMGVHNAFYQLSPTVAIIPAIALGWILHRGSTERKMHAFLDGMRHPDIITMCIIFLLAGAFSSVTNAIGSVDATVNLALSFISPQFLLIGLFITAAFISFAIGTSMGTIATIAPLAACFAQQGVCSPIISMATVVGGAMFGDNLSIISDTTIAAVMSQEANMQSKLRLNAVVAFMASFITVVILFFAQDSALRTCTEGIFLTTRSALFIFDWACAHGHNVFIVLFVSLIWVPGLSDYLHHGYTLFALNADIVKGFASMHEIMLLSLDGWRTF